MSALPSRSRSAEAEAAAAAYLELVSAFERRVGVGASARAARDLMRVARDVSGAASARLASQALRLDPALPAHALARRRDRRRAGSARREAEVWLRSACAGRRRSAHSSHRGVSGADAVSVSATRQGRRTLGDRSHGSLRGRERRPPDLANLICASRGVSPRHPDARSGPTRAARLPDHAGSRRRAQRVASGRRGRLRLEHVRGAGCDCMVTAQGRSVRPRGGEPRRGAAVGMAAGRERSGRSAGRHGCIGDPRHGHPRARLDGCARCCT